MADITTAIISVIGVIISVTGSFLIAKYYGVRSIETRRSRMEHSTKLKDDFFKPWLEKIGEYNDEYCKIGVQYSKEIGKMVSLKPREPDNLKFYHEAMSHLKNYEQLLEGWENIKQITLKLNEELAILFEENRILVKKDIDMPYWCPRYSGDEPDEYLCPDMFIGAIYEEVEGRLKTGRKQFIENGTVETINYGEKKIYCLKWWHKYLARSPDEKLIKKAQQLFSRLIEDERYKEKIKAFVVKQKETYNVELEKVKKNIGEIIKSIELGNVIKGKCGYCEKM
jgi:hypothetical protein